MERPRIVLAAIAAGLLAIGALVYFTARPAPKPTPPAPAMAAKASPPLAATATPSPAPAANQSVARPTGDRMQDLLTLLQYGTSAEEARRRMQELRDYLRGLPKAEALRMLQQFLASRADAKAPLDFRLAADGSLTEAPTMRVWLLDTLGQIDPAAAAEFARGILNDQATSTADEWAIALRDYARSRPDATDRQFVEAKLRELFSNGAWRERPSAGFLEAFDTVVYLNATGFTPELATMIKDQSRRDLPHAAYLTLDRLVLQEPAKVLGTLQAQPELMEGREKTRANYFARADVRDPDQRALLEQYLLDARRSPQELETFAGLYPSGNYMVSNNLLTRVETPTQQQIADKDREALATVEKWLADPRFTKLQPQLRKVRERLQTFVQQAAANP